MILQNDLSDSAYKQMEGINFSSFKHFFTSPSHFKWELEQPNKDSDDLVIGNAVHCAVLTPNLLDKKYAVAPKVDRRKTEDKIIWNEFVALSQGKTVLTEEQWAVVASCSSSMLNNKYFKYVFDKNDELYVETAGNCEFAGSMIKGRIDLYNKTKNIIFDIKTCKDMPSRHKLQRIIKDRMYYMQGFFYRTIVNANWKPIETPKVVFGFVHKKAPNTIGHVEFSTRYMDKACNELEDSLCRYENCKIHNLWPESPESSEPMIMNPEWTLDTEDDTDDTE